MIPTEYASIVSENPIALCFRIAYSFLCIRLGLHSPYFVGSYAEMDFRYHFGIQPMNENNLISVGIKNLFDGLDIPKKIVFFNEFLWLLLNWHEFTFIQFYISVVLSLEFVKQHHPRSPDSPTHQSDT